MSKITENDILLCERVFILTFTFVEILIGLFMKKGTVHRKWRGDFVVSSVERTQRKTRRIALSIL